MRNPSMLIAFAAVTAIASILFAAGCGQGTPVSQFSSTNQSVPAGSTASWNFDKEAAGSLPQGAVVYSGKWEVKPEAGSPSPSNAFCQTGNATYPAVRLGDQIYANVTVSTKFKPVSGSQDQAAGIIFRVQNQDNYYILRANALENNVNLYKYASGIRSTIKEGSVPVKSGEWQSLRMEADGNVIKGYLNDHLVLEAGDSDFSAGYIGLWTKSDSVTCFDDIQVTAQ